jgi:tyrosine-protein phosphatase SIW14
MQNLKARFSIPNFAAAAILSITVLATCAFAQVTGVGNFYQVNEQLYRGAQPTTEGFQSLAKLGVKTVIDLRETDGRSALEKKTVEANGMRYINIPLQGMSAPKPADVDKVLAIFNDRAAGPVFVHCRRGADRTGTVVACYRISHDGWDNSKALHEARADGMSWIELAMQRYVMHYQGPKVSATAAAAMLGPGQ